MCGISQSHLWSRDVNSISFIYLPSHDQPLGNQHINHSEHISPHFNDLLTAVCSLNVIDFAFLARPFYYTGQVHNCIDLASTKAFIHAVSDLLGRLKGKSTLASIIAENMYHPNKQATKANAPPASASFLARDALPLAAWK